MSTDSAFHKVAKKPLGYVMSKTEAQALADRLRSEIRGGRSAPAQPEPTVVAAPLTFGEVATNI